MCGNISHLLKTDSFGSDWNVPNPFQRSRKMFCEPCTWLTTFWWRLSNAGSPQTMRFGKDWLCSRRREVALATASVWATRHSERDAGASGACWQSLCNYSHCQKRETEGRHFRPGIALKSGEKGLNFSYKTTATIVMFAENICDIHRMCKHQHI